MTNALLVVTHATAKMTGERPITDILTSLRYWIIHSVTVPSLFLAGWIFVATGIASDVFGTTLVASRY